MKPSKLGKSPIETQKFSAAERYLEYTPPIEPKKE
jgi:hypothetical protein